MGKQDENALFASGGAHDPAAGRTISSALRPVNAAQRLGPLPFEVIERTYGARILGKVLRTLREDQGYSRLDLANHVEMDPKYLARIEYGNCSVSLRKLAPLCFALGFTLSKIFHVLETINETDAPHWFTPRADTAGSRDGVSVYHLLRDAAGNYESAGNASAAELEETEETGPAAAGGSD
ncbi:MAG: helix-turn-helix transcriptional regulator [Bacillota bacterium]|nr:helix-turn-helix transcriptional regulator [Bacillota bacterium]